MKKLEFSFRQNQTGAVHLLIIVAVIGILVFLLFTGTASFKGNKFFSSLFPKQASLAASNLDVTASLENLGNPTRTRWPDNSSWLYPRNVWDLQVFGSKIYIGSGDGINNSGSNTVSTLGQTGTEIWSYDTLTNQFVRENTQGANCGSNCIDDEAIELFRVTGKELYADGIDPLGSPTNGDLIRLEGSSFHEYQTVPSAVHVYEMDKFKDPTTGTDKIFVGKASGLVMSSDNGLTFTTPTYTNNGLLNLTTVFGVFEFNNQLYASTYAGSFLGSTAGNVLAQYTGGNTFNFLGAELGNLMFPGTNNFQERVYRAVHANSHMVYLASVNGGDNEPHPNGLYQIVEDGSSNISQAVSTAKPIILPNNALARDTLVSGSTFYVLATVGTAPNVVNYVYSSADAVNWTEVMHFSSDTFARSFEYLNGDFYFGLGGDVNASTNSTGNILRLKSVGTNPSPTPPVILGDLDNSKKVDIFDYNILLTNFGKTGSGLQGDIDNNGKVDIFDYNILLTNFGKTSP